MKEYVFEDSDLITHLKVIGRKRTGEGKSVTLNELKLDALRRYLLREGLSSEQVETILKRNPLINKKIKEIAIQKSVPISSIFEQAYREFCGEEISKKPMERKSIVTEKKKSFFDLNAGIQRK